MGGWRPARNRASRPRAECGRVLGRAPGAAVQPGRSGPHSAEIWRSAPPSGRIPATFSAGGRPCNRPLSSTRYAISSSRSWTGTSTGPPRFRWGTVIHRRNERGKLRFGAITPQGESLLLSEPMLDELAATPCWLDGAVRVRLESRRIADPASLAGRAGPPESSSAGRSAGGLLRSRHLARRGDGVPGDGRGADPGEVPVRAVLADQANRPAGWPL